MNAPDGTGRKKSQDNPSTKQEKEKAPFAEMQPLAARQDTVSKLALTDEVSSLKEQLRQEQEKSKEYFNKLLYAQADFENYRKRLNNEVESRIEAGKAKLIQNLLTVVDELELALGAATKTEGGGAVVEGLEVVLKKLHDLLATEGLTTIETIGKKFDPALHETVERIQRGDAEEGTILEEVRKGFTLKGKLIRPSIVKIAVPQIAESDRTQHGESEKV